MPMAGPRIRSRSPEREQPSFLLEPTKAQRGRRMLKPEFLKTLNPVYDDAT
jgi:hypothetical protein